MTILDNMSRKEFFSHLILRQSSVMYQDDRTVDQWATIDEFDFQNNRVWISDIRTPGLSFSRDMKQVWVYFGKHDEDNIASLQNVCEKIAKWTKGFTNAPGN